MTYEIAKPILAFATTLALSACGGGGGSGSDDGGGTTPDTPDSNRGYADGIDDDVLDENSTTTVSGIKMLVRDDGVGSVKTVEIPFRFTVSNGLFSNIVAEYDLFDGGEQLMTDETNNGDYFERDVSIGGEEEFDALFRELAQSDNNEVGSAWFRIDPDDGGPAYFEDTIVVYGFDTDPDTVQALTGGAEYVGDLHILAIQGGTRATVDTAADGSFLLEASFDTNTVSGSVDIDAISGFSSAETFELVETAIDQNGFDGNIATDTELDAALSLTSGEYAGQFYGVDGLSVGGTILIQLDDSASDDPIFIQGGFVGSED